MIRTSLFLMDVDLGKINDTSKACNVSIPPEWTNGCDHALFVKNYQDETIKIVPIEDDQVSMIRIKCKDIKKLMVAAMKIASEYGLTLLHRTGVCKEIEINECYTEIVVKRDENLIKNFVDLKTNKETIDEILVIRLNDDYTAFKKSIVALGLEDAAKKMLSLQIPKTTFINLLDRMKKSNKYDVDQKSKIHDLMINVSTNFL